MYVAGEQQYVVFFLFKVSCILLYTEDTFLLLVHVATKLMISAQHSSKLSTCSMQLIVSYFGVVMDDVSLITCWQNINDSFRIVESRNSTPSLCN